MNDGGWTLEQKGYLEANAQKLTATQMARVLGRSRGSVIGKCSREGINLNGPDKKPRNTGKLVFTKVGTGKKVAAKETRPLKQLGTNQAPQLGIKCQWPTGDVYDGTLRFCARKATSTNGKHGGRLIYCETHAAIAYGRAV